MPERYRVVLNGVTLFKNMSRAEAEAKAEKWQGSHAGNRGLLKHKDRGDYVEVKRDHESERDFDEMYERLKDGQPQRYNVVGRIN